MAWSAINIAIAILNRLINNTLFLLGANSDMNITPTTDLPAVVNPLMKYKNITTFTFVDKITIKYTVSYKSTHPT